MTSRVTQTRARAGDVGLGTLIRVCVVAMPVAGGLKLLGNLTTFNGIGYGVPQAAEARVASSVGFVVGEFVGSVLPVIIAPFWLFAVYAYLANLTSRRTLTAGVVLCLLGAGVTLPALGVINYAFPALAHAYLDGDVGAMSIVDSFFTWPRGAMLYPALLYPIGTVFLTVAMWRAGVLPRLAIVGFVLGGFLIAIPIPLHEPRLAGGVLGLLAGVWLTAAVWRDTRATDRRLSIRPQPDHSDHGSPGPRGR